MYSTAFLATLLATAAAKDSRTFAVLHHHNQVPLVEARIDPVAHRNEVSLHLHSVMGASNFAMDTSGAKLRESSCTTANIMADLSSYWFPTLFFQDPEDGHFEKVDMYYFNVYYFFEATNDQLRAFPTGLRMLSGKPDIRTPINNASGAAQYFANEGDIVSAVWTCPRSTSDPPSWPADSDGSTAGIADPQNANVGSGFPQANCDGYVSPLRMDVHFPSCYNPAADLEDYEHNTAFPSDVGSGKQDCPEGWTHLPHIFYEVYWQTPKFLDRWTPGSGKQPFVLSSGDRTGFSAHADFIAAWDEDVLQQIIDGCNVGHAGMETCPGMAVYDNTKAQDCTIESPIDEQITGKLAKLPGDNPAVGWGIGNVTDVTHEQSSSSTATATAAAATSKAPIAGQVPAYPIEAPVALEHEASTTSAPTAPAATKLTCNKKAKRRVHNQARHERRSGASSRRAKA